MASLHPVPPFDELTYFPSASWIRATRGATRSSIPGARCWCGSRARGCQLQLPRQDVAPEAAAEGRGFDDRDLDGYVSLSWDAAEHWV